MMGMYSGGQTNTPQNNSQRQTTVYNQPLTRNPQTQPARGTYKG